MFWCVAPFAIDLRIAGFHTGMLFAGIGLFFPAAVTLLTFESNRLLGANIAGAVAGLAPVFAVVLALGLLGEHPRPAQWLALAAIVAGMMLIDRRRQQRFPASSLWMLAVPLAAAVIRGGVQPVIKLGLRRWDSPVAAVVIGYTISAVVLISAAVIRSGGWPHGFDRRGALWFAVVGICNGVSVLTTYAALGYGTIALVSPLIACYPLVTVLLGHVLLKDEPINTQMLVAVAAMVGGVIVLIIG